jgi:hypothetical protein
MTETPKESIDVRWLRERRRFGIRMGLNFAGIGLAYRFIERTGVLAPIFGTEAAAGGPFSLRWIAAALTGAMIAGFLFGFSVQWAVPAPKEHEVDA